MSGWYAGDLRLLDRWSVSVAGSDLDLVRASDGGAARHEFTYVAGRLGDRVPDPTVRLDRTRVLDADGVREEIEIESVAHDPVEVELRIDLGSDLAPLAVVKQGGAGSGSLPARSPGELQWASSDDVVSVAADRPRASTPRPDAWSGG